MSKTQHPHHADPSWRTFVRSHRLLLGILGSLLLAFVYAVYPFITGKSQMLAFCGALKTGTSMQEIERVVEERGFRISFGTTQAGLVHNTRSFGRFLCEVRFDGGHLVTAKYVDND